MVSTASNQEPRKLYSLKKLVRGSGSQVLRMVLLAAIGFFLMPFTIHRLGSEEYGIWAIAMTFIGYYSFLDLGLSGAVFTHMAYALGREDYEEARNIYGSSLWIFGVVGLILMAATLVLAAGVYFLHYSHGVLLAEVLLIVGFSTATSFGMRVPFGVLNAGQNFDITAWVLVLSGVLRCIGTVLVLDAHYGVVALAWLSVITALPANIIVVWSVHRKFPFLKIFSWPQWNKTTARKLFGFGGPVLVGQIADRIRFQTDTLTVSFFIGLVAVTHYSVGSTLVMYYIDIIAAIISVLTPVLSMQKSVSDDTGFKRSFLFGTRVALAASAFIAFGMIAWSRDFVILWVGRSFVDVYPVIVVLSLAVLIETSQATSVNALFASLHQKAYAALNISEAASNLILSVLLARPYGMLGVAVGTLIPSIVFRGIIQPIVVERLLDISIRETASLYLRTGSRCAAFLVLPWLITRHWLTPDYPHLIFVAVLSSIVYVLPIWWLEFNGIGTDRLLAPIRTARRILFAR
ncbi:MAG TPA: flippase [Acidobacteriaceae bacterium]|nr:flippase [Acidobacteriaceae bacterium]